MPTSLSIFCTILLLSVSLAAQVKSIWVLRAPGEITEYDSVTFAAKQTVKVPAESVATPQNLSVNHLGQILFAPSISLPLDEGDVAGKQKVWFWDGHAATTLTRDITHATGKTGSNLAITESAPVPFLSADGAHLYWFSNRERRLQREGVDLSTNTTWSAWQTDLKGSDGQDLVSVRFPDCSCPTGSCEDACPYGEVWVPDEGVDKFFLLIQVVSGKDQTVYKSTSLYQESGGKWSGTAIDPSFQRVLDADGANAILEAIPDTGCCGWANQSDDQTRLRLTGKTETIFDERSEYKNADYDVSFYTENGRLSPDLDSVAFTVVATAEPNQPIQLAEQGQADPEESQRIRKALLDLPAVEIKSLDAKGETPPQLIARLSHATLVGWISEKEILVVEDHVLAVYNMSSKTRRKSNVAVEDGVHVFLR